MATVTLTHKLFANGYGPGVWVAACVLSIVAVWIGELL